MYTNGMIFEGYLNSADDLERLIICFSDVSKAADNETAMSSDKAKMLEKARQLWFNLTAGGADKNVYSVGMPYLCKACCENTRCAKTAFIFDDDVLKMLGVEPNSSTVILFSSTLIMNIKEKPEDVGVKRDAIWVPPRDFRLLMDMPAPKCYVEIFLIDKEYALNYEEVTATNPKNKIYNYFNTMYSRACIEFKQTFLGE